MGKVFYVAFHDAKLINDAEEVCSLHANQGFEARPKVHRGFSPQVLTEIDNGDELYVAAHGNLQRAIIANTLSEGSGRKELTPAELAHQVFKDGLPTSHRTIKLWICYSGLNPPAFGRQFSSALYKLGYTRCEVFGYADAIQRGAAGGHKKAEVGNRNASEVRVEVDNLSALQKLARFFRIPP